MQYVMSDLHGAYDKYQTMLRRIQFQDTDTLYILGDVVDRGKQGIKILLDMMLYPNIVPLLGNHEYMAATCLPWLMEEISDTSIQHMDEERIAAMSDWIQNGGMATIAEFKALDVDERQLVLDYLMEFTLCEEVQIHNKRFLLAHAGFQNYAPTKPLAAYTLEELLWTRSEDTAVEDPDLFFIRGHTPTLAMSGKAEIYHHHPHIHIDCGAIYPQGRLACLCLDTMEEFYV